jgi:lipoprotein-anchoring transpeptidase ErfK/SrfK
MSSTPYSSPRPKAQPFIAPRHVRLPVRATPARRSASYLRPVVFLWNLFPREIRLMGITAGVVILSVMGSADVLGASAEQAATITTHYQVTSVPAPYVPTAHDQSCHIAVTADQMFTPQQIAHPLFSGEQMVDGTTLRKCVVKGLPMPTPPLQAANRPGQVIVVSTAKQWLWAYQDGNLVFATPVTTGMNYLRTPHGTFSIQYKEKDVTFYSPWPVGSPFYYTPEHINYALNFRAGGFYLHDAPWRQAFGPGTQNPHTDPNGEHEDGSHGCVNLTTGAAQWLYGWAHVGTTVTIV